MSQTERHIEERSESFDINQAEGQNQQTDQNQTDLIDRSNHIQIFYWKCIATEKLLCGIGFLPVTFALLILMALGINYAIAVHLDHVSALFPYVSWLASYGPEEYIFDFLLSLASINVAFIIYFKFKAIESVHNGSQWIKILIFNKVCCWLGFITSFFFLISATFPAVDEKSIQKVHGIASKTGFSVLCLYFIIETAMSYYLRATIPGVTTCICITRTVITCLCCSCLFVAYIAGKKSFSKSPKPKDPKHWKSTDGGYVLHLVATFCEWGIVLTMVAFFLTYVAELKNLKTKIKLTETTGGLRSSQQVLEEST